MIEETIRVETTPRRKKNLATTTISCALLWFALAVWMAPAFAAADIQSLLPACTGCHGSDGVSQQPDIPTIAGTPAGVLEKALQAFRDGAPPCPDSIMCAMSAGLSDEQISALADYFSSKSVISEEPETAGKVEPIPEDPDGASPKIVPRKANLVFYPCSQCHAFRASNPQVRELQAPHPFDLNHGAGRMWCLACHDETDRDQLTTLAGRRIDFDNAPVVCATCHAQRHQDWTFGAHGKRVGKWQGERVVYSCAQCHDPHDPAIKPRAPSPPPPTRIGLERPEGTDDTWWPAWMSQDETRAND
jgi:cytochrome c553